MTWRRLTETMMECGEYQISRTPTPVGGTHIYRAWHRPTNEILLAVTCANNPEARAEAVRACKLKCEEVGNE